MDLPSWINCVGRGAKEKTGEWVFFRKDIRLNRSVSYARARFLSSGVCGLWINGNFVEAATARYPGRVNSHEVTSFIRKGRNVIALQCGSSYFWEEAKRILKENEYPESSVALEFQVLNTKNGIRTITVTNATWRTYRTEVEGWNKVTFDDSDWENASIAGKVKAEEYRLIWDQAATWRDTRRRTPVRVPRTVREIAGDEYLTELKSGFPKYAFPIAVYEKTLNRGIIRNEKALLLDNDQGTLIDTKRGKGHPSIILDFGRTVVGYLEIEFGNISKGTINLEFDYSETPYELKGRYHERKGKHRPEWFEWKDVVEKLSLGVEYDGTGKSWFNLRRRAFRFVRITFQKFDRPISVKRIGLRYSCYPARRRGYFSCSDVLLNEIWEVANYTFWVNMHQEYESCPRNEMLYFSGDGRICGLNDFYAFGDGQLSRSSLALRDPKDRRPLYGLVEPADGAGLELWDYPAWRIISIYDYYVYTGDSGFAQSHYAAARRAIEWMIQRIGRNGLIDQLPFGTVEWTCSRERLGEKTFLNALFYKALLDMIALSEIAGNKREARRWQKIADNVKSLINLRLWSAEKHVYIDCSYDYVPQDGNALAINFGIAEKVRAERILEYLKSHLWSSYGSAMFDRVLPHTRGGSKTISPFMSTYEAEAHFCMGQARDGLDLIRRVWGTMLKKGARNFWEFSPNNPRDEWPVRCHGWSAGPIYLLSAYVVGIKPTAPGFRKVSIIPRLGNLKWAKGVVPTPEGLIACSVEKRPKEVRMTLSIPKGCDEAHVGLPIHGEHDVKVYVNRRLVWGKARFISALPSLKTAYREGDCIHLIIRRHGKYSISGREGGRVGR